MCPPFFRIKFTKRLYPRPSTCTFLILANSNKNVVYKSFTMLVNEKTLTSDWGGKGGDVEFVNHISAGARQNTTTPGLVKPKGWSGRI